VQRIFTVAKPIKKSEPQNRNASAPPYKQTD